MSSAVTKGLATAGAAVLLAGCTSSGNPFANPFGSAPPRQQLPIGAQPASAPQSPGGVPTVTIAAPQKRVQDTIVARAQRRGTNVLGANNTGVTLEIPLRQSSDPIVQQCGPHQDGRAVRVYLETIPTAAAVTTVNEQKFIVDGASVCNYSPNESDVAESNRSLADLKREAEQRRAASAASSGGAADPQGGIEALDPRRPVRPLQ
jgi:hypothetical protein